MIKRFLVGIMVCMLLIIPALALASEAGEDVFVNPTRDPGAPAYKEDHPEELVEEQLVARSYILMERSSKDILMFKEENLRGFPASTTKIMTALIALYAGNLDDTLVISETARNIPEDSSVVPFKVGEVVTLRDALYGMMLRSGNEAANAIAEYVAGDIETFVAQMNETAAMLGCTNTNFVNPHGYHNEWHQTTAHDLALIMDAAMDNETFRQIIKARSWDLSGTVDEEGNAVNPPRKIFSTNLHLDPENKDYYYRYSLGGKTGFTSDAGYVLVEAAEKDGVELIAVIMYSSKYARWPDTTRLFEYGFTQYRSVTPEDIYEENVADLQISGFSTSDTKRGHLTLDIRPTEATREIRFTGSNAEIESIISNAADYTSYTWTAELRAPIERGDVMGTVTFYSPTGDSAVYELVASRSVPVREDAPPTLEEIVQRVEEDPNPFPPLSLDWILPPAIGAVAGVFVLRAIIKFIIKHAKRSKQIPKPKKRTFR